MPWKRVKGNRYVFAPEVIVGISCAIFAGGYDGSWFTSFVDGYDSSLIRSTL